MKKFTWRLAFLVGLTGIASGLFERVFNVYVPIFLQTGHPLWEATTQNSNITGFALGPTVAFFIMTWDNIIHMFLVPWAGAKSDTTWTRFGRRMPWMLVGLPIAVIGFTLIPFATTLAAIMIFIVLANVGAGLYRAPTRAWLGDFFEPTDRTKAEAPLFLVASIGFVIALVVGGALFDQGRTAAPFLIGSTLVILAGLGLFIFLKEEKDLIVSQDKEPASSNAILDMFGKMRLPAYRSVLYAFVATFLFHTAHASFQAGASGFGVFEVGLSTGRVAQIIGVSGLVFIPLAIPSGLLANRFGARRVMMAGMAFYALNATVTGLFVNTETTFLISLVVGGMAWAFVFVNSLPLVMNTDDGDNFGVFTGLYYLAFQVANVIGPVLTGGLIQLAGSQRILWALMAVCMLLAFLALTRVTDRDFKEVESVLASD